jgi:hypothetical protein
MEFDFNILQAYDKDNNLVAEFTEFEDAAKFWHANNKEYRILMYNKKFDVYFTVPDDELPLPEE